MYDRYRNTFISRGFTLFDRFDFLRPVFNSVNPLVIESIWMFLEDKEAFRTTWFK